MSSTAYKALSLILFLLGIFGILFTATEAIVWSRDGTYDLAILSGVVTAICYWASGIFFERGFLTDEYLVEDLGDVWKAVKDEPYVSERFARRKWLDRE